MSYEIFVNNLATSRKLDELQSELPDENISLKELINTMSSEGVQFLIIILLAPFLIPASIPGSSTPFGVLIILVIALAIPMNGASLGLLFPILLIAGIRFVPQLMKNSSKLEDEQQARRDERERAEKHYRDLKNSIPALEQKVAECEQAYNDALRQLSQLE